MKRVRDVFNDCAGIDTVLDAEIEEINLYKKANRLEIKLATEEKIDIEQISIFEAFLKEKLNVRDVIIRIVGAADYSYDISNEWEKIAQYFGLKFPSIKAVLSSSSVEVKDKEIKIVLDIKGKDLLKAVKLDKIVAEFLENIYGERYIIKYAEKGISTNNYETLQKQMEQEAIQEAIQQAQLEAEKRPSSTKEVKSPKKTNHAWADVIRPAKAEEIAPSLIYGRTINIKQETTNIIEISADTDKVCVEGEVISTESREIKDGKVIVMFDVFDGTSTITCKAFIENKKAYESLEKIKNSKGIKVYGTARYDQFAREITIMAINIIETARKRKEKENGQLARKKS